MFPRMFRITPWPPVAPPLGADDIRPYNNEWGKRADDIRPYNNGRGKRAENGEFLFAIFCICESVQTKNRNGGGHFVNYDEKSLYMKKCICTT